VFDGRQLTEETVHHYDAAGRLARSVTTHEPLWLEIDQVEILALAEYRAGLCPLHGGPLEECQSRGSWEPDYKVEISRCHATYARLAAMESDEIKGMAAERGGSLLLGTRLLNRPPLRKG
jgi:hypothetical protein